MEGYPQVVAIVGPTAVGKSHLATALCREFAGDVLSADSRQIYRYLDIGTSKPSPLERAEARHYMLDLVEPDDAYSAQRFRAEADRVLHRIAGMGRVAFVVGGTGFYVRALLDGAVLPEVAPDPRLRDRLRLEAQDHGPEALHRRLATLDPASAQRVHARNLPRIIRALEIVEQTGGPVPAPTDRHPIAALRLGLTADRRDLDRVADERVLSQMGAGLLDEVRLLLDMGYSPETPGLAGFGYREMVAHLRGTMTLDAAIAAYQRATRRYIRRQMTWFRAQPEVEWLQAGDDLVERARRRVEGWLNRT